ncbi:hypothetical protein SAMN04488700_1372 [Carnobacterium iners]|uniref:Uncharacterized protein n=1 Tax=Carnobacterium iners TaxID=1073423 RepID=A0A1X7N691_9LACT|nr:hypothetical protein [Carnobacterium iners]SEK60326.1 hypothetical protein SAMN04488114_10711 [Carnobacterium iners]SMH32283.1 hypothetical protein SAMN04488700_1372 [Carnobacterium iners]
MEEIENVDLSKTEEQANVKKVLYKDLLYEKIDVSVDSINKFIFGIVVALAIALLS